MSESLACDEEALIGCLHCGQVCREPQLLPGQKARCPRCASVLLERKRYGLSNPLALAIAALFLFIISNSFPLIELKIAGREQTGLIMTGIRALYDDGYGAIALLVFMVTIIAPLIRILSVLYVLIPLLGGASWPFARRVFRTLEGLQPWAMSEVFMLGILVALVKLGDLATIKLGIGLISFGGMIVILAAMDAAMDDHEIWKCLDGAKGFT
jgi:paraquat-inducible protein A